MGIWGWITGAQQVDKAMDIAKDATSGIIAGIDAAFFTDEEKSRAALLITEAGIRMVEATQGESTVRSVTRRVLAWMIMGTFLFLVLFAALIWKVDTAWALHVLECVKALGSLALAVGIFYFGYYGIKQLRDKS